MSVSCRSTVASSHGVTESSVAKSEAVETSSRIAALPEPMPKSVVVANAESVV